MTVEEKEIVLLCILVVMSFGFGFVCSSLYNNNQRLTDEEFTEFAGRLDNYFATIGDESDCCYLNGDENGQ